MKQMRTSLFKTSCLKTIDDVHATGEPVVIAKRGAPVAKIDPMVSADSDLFGFMADEARIVGDIEVPIARVK
jgi:antitoxin (DNA-binding transcriptional repressor) of toxin-antitoxin stability system